MNIEPTEDEIKTATSVLKKLKPGYLPFPIFHEVTRLTATPIIEIVPLRRNKDVVEILLLKRAVDDPVWPNQLHTPGTVLRATDTLKTALERILTNELNSIKVSEPKFVSNVLHDSGRGKEVSQVFWVEVKDEISIGEFYNVTKLPAALVKSQIDFIPRAIADYKARF